MTEAYTPTDGLTVTKDELERVLRVASDKYYNTEKPVMSDQVFDKLKAKLQELDPDNQFLKEIGSPPRASHLDKVKHNIPMGSLSNCSKEGDKANPSFQEWYSSKDGGEICLMHKLDGSSIELIYEDGKMVQAITRGDGSYGEDVTRNARRFKGVLNQLKSNFTGSIRGEIILLLDDWKKWFTDTANPRNAANGTVRRKSGARAEHLSFISYDLINGKEFQTHREKLEFLSELGLPVVWYRVLDNLDDISVIQEEQENSRDSLPYEIDGLVIRVNDNERFESLGERDNRPKGAIAYKFEVMGSNTKLLGISWTMGHTGAHIPTGILEPVKIGGVTVSNVLLNNMDYIDELGLGIGDIVEVCRAGDVIPMLKRVISKALDRIKIKPPTNCIACESILVKDGAHLFCKNEDCTGRQFRLLKTWITKRNILHIGDELLTLLYDKHNVKEPADLYELSEEFLYNLPRGNGIVGTNSKRIMEELDKSRECSLSDLLGSLGIPLMGRRKVEIMINLGINSLEKFLSISEDELGKLEGFNTISAAEIVNGIKRVRDRISKLLKHLKLIEPEAPKLTGGPLSGFCFVFTGAIEKVGDDGKRFTRKMMWDVVKENGGLVEDNIKAGVTHLVQADPSSESSKTKKAKKSGVKIISEAEFWGMVNK